MSSLEPLITYTRGASGFAQKFFINQNGVFIDLTLLSGDVTVIWWFKSERPGSVAKSITWTDVIDGANNNRVTFVMPVGFLDVGGIDYDCNIEVYNDSILSFSTIPDFVVRVKEPAGYHGD